MNTRAKSIAIILSTLIVGGVLGGVIVGTISSQRSREFHHMLRDVRRPGGFVERFEGVIEPRDAAQRDAIMPILEAAEEKNRAAIRQAHETIRSGFDSMMTALSPHLDASQRARLEEEFERMKNMPHHPPGMEPRHHRRRGR